MVRVDPSRAIVVHLSWLGALVGALVAMMAEVSPVRLSFIRPETLFVAFTEVQVFFAALVWPLFLPWLLRDAGMRGILLEIGLLVVFALPLALLCADVSNAGAGAVIRAQLLVAALASLAAGLRKSARWYILAILALSAAPPFLQFVVRVLGHGPDLSWAAWASPFWAAARIDEAWSLAAAALLAGASGIAFALARPAEGGSRP
jgi:hypothetical protein